MRILVASLVACLLLAGCTSTVPQAPVDPAPLLTPHLDVVEVQPTNALHFTQSVVTAAVDLAQDLYEPNLEVSDKGTIYVVSHVTGAATTGSPAYVSTDDGKTWVQLPFLRTAATPPPGQGSALPPGDEGYIVPAEDGRAYMADVSLSAFPVEGWCDDGARQCYHNPNAYDRAASTTSPCFNGDLNDRPWAAYANHTLLLVNNAGTGAVQVGVMTMPPAMEVDPLPAAWNMCAATGGGIPGIPALRADGHFAVPQVKDKTLTVVTGTVQDLATTQVVDAFTIKAGDPASYGGGAQFGVSAFDAAGNLYVGVEDNDGDNAGFSIGFSPDAGATFETTRFEVKGDVGFLHIDGLQSGAGAIVSWAQGASGGKADFYVGHLVPEPGGVRIEDVSLAAQGTQPCGDVMGSGAGPDGRAYVVVYSDANPCTGTPLGTPVSVYIESKPAAPASTQ